MTLQSFETYGYINNKTKSYQIQREFLLLFIFLGYQAVLSSRMPLSHTILPIQCYFVSRLFQRFCSMGYTTEFYQNLNAVCIAKALDQDAFQ